MARESVLKSWEEVALYKAKHLTPVGKTPKGEPIYDYNEVKALKIRLAEEKVKSI